MKAFPRFLLKAAGFSLAVFGTGGAMAATECNGPLSATVTAGVVVNAGDTCFLAGANVYGGVRVNKGGILKPKSVDKLASWLVTIGFLAGR